jgi:GNAT superfamily N-acetyltransferase
LEIRPATLQDLPALERRCWFGGEDEMRHRITDQGTCSIIAVDEGRPIGQLYLRAYEPGYRSPAGLHDGGFWADLKGVEPEAELPARTVMLGCWHVGWARNADGTETEAPEYRGRGIGVALLKAAIDWAESEASPFDAVAAKATDSEERSYISWVGNLPLPVFEAHGFERLESFDDPYFLAEPDAVPDSVVAERPARFHLVVRRNQTR